MPVKATAIEVLKKTKTRCTLKQLMSRSLLLASGPLMARRPKHRKCQSVSDIKRNGAKSTLVKVAPQPFALRDSFGKTNNSRAAPMLIE